MLFKPALRIRDRINWIQNSKILNLAPDPTIFVKIPNYFFLDLFELLQNITKQIISLV